MATMALVCAFAVPAIAFAQVGPLRGVLDVSLQPFAGSDLLEDQAVFVDDLAGLLFEASLGQAVAAEVAAEVVALHTDANATLFVLDTARRLGSVDVTPRDVVAFDGVGYALAFDGALEGLSPTAAIDAVTRGTDGALVLSFDGFVSFGGAVAADEDLVRWDGSGLALAFDGSSAGVPIDLDVDAASYAASGALFLSFDGPGRIADVDFFDEDVLEYDPASATWAATLAIDASAASVIGASAFVTADLKAMHVPEPGAATGLLLGALGTFELVSRRRRSAAHRRPRGAVPAAWGLAAIALASAPPAQAADGVIEINQACAVNTGCFPGDGAGFPVEIGTAGGVAFRLTSDLVVADTATSGLLITAEDVRIDLGGFRVITAGCQASPIAGCSPGSGSGKGIDATAARFLSVEDGTVAGFGTEGIQAGDYARLERVEVRWNTGDGILLGAFANVLGGSVQENERNGLIVGARSYVEGTSIVDNMLGGLVATSGSSIVEGVTVVGHGRTGIAVRESVVRNSSVSASGATGIAEVDRAGIYCADRCVLERNQVRGSDADGILCSSSCVVHGNHVEASDDDGISCSVACVVAENSVWDSNDEAIRMINGGRVRGNVIDTSADDGIVVGTTSAFEDNAIANVTDDFTAGNGTDVGGNLCGTAPCP